MDGGSRNEMTEHSRITPSPSANRPHRVLLVDDDPQLIQVFAAWLKDEGFETELAFDGIQALDAIAEVRPDLVVADVSMPRMDGVTLALRLRMLQIPIILISANPPPSTTDPEIPFLRKPFDLTALLNVIRRHLRPHHRPHS